MLNLKRILVFGLLFFTLLASAQKAKTFQRIPKADTKPVIDGAINDTEWKNAAILSQFSDAGNRRPASSPTTVWVQYDDENLYIAFRAKIDFEPIAEPIPHDNMNITTVDCVRIGIVPPGAKTWMKFSLERGGGTSDMRVAGQVRQPAAEWEPQWQSAVRIVPLDYFAANIWEGEIAISWATLEMEPPKPGDELPFQFTRYAGNTRRSVELNNRITVWAPVPSVWNIIDPTGFGKLIFGNDGPVFQFGEYTDPASGEYGFGGDMTRKSPGANLSARVWAASNYSKVYGQAKALPVADWKISWIEKSTVREKSPAIFNWRLDDAVGPVAGNEIICDLSPLFLVEAAPIYSQEKVVILGNLSKLDISNGMRVVSTLKNSAGKTVAEKSQPLAAGAKYFEEALSLDKLPVNEEGQLRVVLQKNQKELHSYDYKFKNPARPEWMNQTYGKVTAPPPGWQSPVVEAGKDSVKVRILDNHYQFGAGFLPDEIALRGAEFSNGAMRFQVTTAQGVQEIRPSQPLKVLKQDKRGVTLQWSGASPELALSADVRVEFDGLAWYNLTVKNKQPGVKINELSMILPVKPDQVRYMRGLNAMGTMNPISLHAMVGAAKTDRALPKPNMASTVEISGNGWNFEHAFANFLWLGGEDRGLFFVLPSLQDIHVRKNYFDVTDTPEKFEFKVNLIDSETELKRDLNYEFAMILTPAKRLSNPSAMRRIGAAFAGLQTDGSRVLEQKAETYKPFGRRFFHDPELKPFEKDYFTTAILRGWIVKTAMVGNPTPPEKELADIDAEVKAIRNTIGGLPMLWYDSLFTMFQLPQAIDYVYEWELYPQCRLPIEQYGTFVCPTEAWSDYYLYGAVNRMKQGIKAFYMDMSGYHACNNRFHGCGYRDEATGEIHPRIAFMEGREMFLRYQNLVKANDPEGLLVMHCATKTPIALWMDNITNGEEWTIAHDYSTLVPEFYQLANMGTAQLGTSVSFFPGLILTFYQQAAKSNVTLAEVCGLTFLHGESMWNGVPAQLAGLRLVWDAMDRFGVDKPDASWTPYWRNPASKYPNDGVAVSSYERDGKFLLVIFNVAYEEKSYDLGRWSGRVIRDTLNNYAEVPAKALKMPSRGFRLLQVE